MFPEAVRRRVERADDGGVTYSELRADSSPDERPGEKYCDSQSGSHEDDSRSDFGLSPDSVVNEVRWRSLASTARIAARFFSPSSSIIGLSCRQFAQVRRLSQVETGTSEQGQTHEQPDKPHTVHHLNVEQYRGPSV